MNLQTELDREWRRLQGVGGTLQVSLDDGEVRGELPVVDRVGCETRSLLVSSQSLAGASTDRLARIGDDLAARLTYLLEPLRVVEVDGQAQVVQMRSVPPSATPAGRSYFEVLVRAGGEIELVRYAVTPGQPRSPVPALFTREVFFRLVEDLVEALA